MVDSYAITSTYWMAGLAPEAARFFKFLFILILYSLALTLFVSGASFAFLSVSDSSDRTSYSELCSKMEVSLSSSLPSRRSTR